MPGPTIVEFLNAVYPEPIAGLGGPGKPLPQAPWLAVWSKSRDGKRLHTDWCRDVERAALVALRACGEADVYFGVALQDRDAAVEIARVSRKRSTPLPPHTVRGSAGSAATASAVRKRPRRRRLFASILSSKHGGRRRRPPFWARAEGSRPSHV